jgi:hypothetical protein
MLGGGLGPKYIFLEKVRKSFDPEKVVRKSFDYVWPRDWCTCQKNKAFFYNYIY